MMRVSAAMSAARRRRRRRRRLGFHLSGRDLRRSALTCLTRSLLFYYYSITVRKYLQ